MNFKIQISNDKLMSNTKLKTMLNFLSALCGK